MYELLRVSQDDPAIATAMARQLAATQRESGVSITTDGGDVVFQSESGLVACLSMAVHGICTLFAGTARLLTPGMRSQHNTATPPSQPAANQHADEHELKKAA